MKKKLHKIIAFTLAFVVTCCSLGLNLPTLAGNATGSELRESGWGYAFTADIGGNSVSYLDRAFDVYQYTKPTTADTATAIVGPVEPSATDSNSYEGKYSYFTTQIYGSNSKGGLKPTSIQGGNGKGFTTLTYAVESLKNFEAEYEFYGNSGQLFGLMFGAEKNVFPITFDNNSANDTGVMLFMESSGKLQACGAMNTATVSATGGASISKDTTAKWYPNITGAANIYGSITGDDKIEMESNISENSASYTVCVKVENGVMTVYEKNHSNIAVTVTLTDKYQGGYVSLVSNNCEHGAFKSFRIKNTEWDYSMSADIGGNSVSYLDRAFDVYQYTKPTTVDAATAIVGPVEPSVTDPNSYEGKYSYFTTQIYGSNSKGGLKPTSIQGGNGKGFTTLTYAVESLENFEAEYEFYGNSGQLFGLMFGAEKNVFPITFDNNNANDTGVMLFMESSGKLQACGAMNTATVSATGGASISKDTTAKWYPNITGAANIYGSITGDDKIEMESNISENSASYTVCVKVENGVMTVYEKNHSNIAVTVTLTDKYQGGYVSLVSNNCEHGAFKSFRITKLPDYGYDFTQMNISDLNKDFASSIVSALVDGTATSGTAETYWEKADNSLRPKDYNISGVQDSQMTLLTLKDKTFKNFRATIDIVGSSIVNRNSVGLIFGQEDMTSVTTMADDSAGEHSAVKVIYRSQYGSVKARGVHANTVQNAGTKTFSDLGGDGWWGRNNNLDSANTLPGFNSAVGAKHTLNIEVIDGILKIWWSETPEYVWQVEVNEYYRGGYVSLWGMRNGGIQRFSIMELPENDYTFAVTDPTDLDDAFTAKVFDNVNKESETKKVSESWMVTNKTNETTGEYAGGITNKNNALKPFKNQGASQTYLLSLKEELANNFAMDYTYVTGYTDVGLYLSDNLDTEPVASPSVDSVKISISKPENDINTYLRIYGAIDIESATTVDNTIVMNNNGASVNVPLNGMDHDAGVAKNNRETIHVQVQERKLTAWVEGYETAKVTVNLNADFNADKLSFFSNGNNQGGFVSMNIDMLPDDATFTSNINFDIQPIGEYTKVTVSTDLDHSSIIGTLNFDNTRYEYFGAALNQNQIIANQGDYITVGEGTLELNIRVNPQNEVLNLYFKNLDTSMNYESMLVKDINGYVANQNEVNVVTTRELDQDYTEDYILNVKDIVRAKVEKSTTVEDVRKVLVGANAETVSPLLGKTALYLGDSIAYGSNDTLRLSWAGRIAQKGMTYDKVAVSGWSVTNTETSGRGQIVTQLNDKKVKTSYDFVILEGGVNDVLLMQSHEREIAWGEVEADSTNYDTSTIAGAIEDLIEKTKAKFPDAIVGYVINNYFGADEDNMTTYRNTVKAACEKHGVSYVDLNEDERTGASVFNSGCALYDDGWLHPNAAGYDIIAQVIGEWMEKLVLGAASN